MSHFKNRSILHCVLGLGLALCPFPTLAQPDLPPEQKVIQEANKTTIRTRVLSPDGRFVALIETHMWFGESGCAYDPKGSRILIWEVASGRLVGKKHTPANDVPQGAFSTDGSKFLCYGMYRRFNGEELVDAKNHIHLWATPSGKSLVALELDKTDEIERLIFTPDGKQLIGKTYAPGKYVTVKTWDADTGKVLHSKARKLDPWDAETWEVQGKYIFSAHPIWSDGRRIMSELRIWSLPGLEELHTIETEPGILQHLAISPDGKRIAFKTDQAKRALEGIQLWDVGSKAPTPLPIPPAERSDIINALEFTSDSQTLVGS